MSVAIRFVGTNGNNLTPGRNGQVIRAICNHVMLGTLDGSRSAFADPSFQASANYGIGHDGTVLQFVRDENTAWANGPIRNPNLDAVPWIADLQARGINPNSVTISIEWEGQHHGGNWIKTGFGGRQLNTLARGSIGHFWIPTEAQYQAGLGLIAQLCEKWHISIDRKHICRHSDFDSVSKWFCPGDGFPMPRLLQDLAALGISFSLGDEPAPIPGPAPDVDLEGDEHARSISQDEKPKS